MGRKLYFTNTWNENQYPDPWISFDSDPDFSNLNRKGMECDACLSRLYHNLIKYYSNGSHDARIYLGEALSCWKAVAALNTPTLEEARALLEENQHDFLPGREPVYGKITKGRQNTIVLYSDTNDEMKLMLDGMKEWSSLHCPAAKIYPARACPNIFSELFGDWNKWEERMRVKKPERIRYVVKEMLGKSWV